MLRAIVLLNSMLIVLNWIQISFRQGRYYRKKESL